MYELNLSCIKLTIQVSFMIRVLLKHFIHVMIKYWCPVLSIFDKIQAK